MAAAKRTRWTRAQAREVLVEHEESGLSVAEFARRRGLHPARIRRWRSVFREEAAHPGLRLVELVARREAPVGRVLLHAPTGHTLEVQGADLADGLRAALTALAEVHGC